MPDRPRQTLPMQQGAVETPRDRNARLDFRAEVAAIRSDVRDAEIRLGKALARLDAFVRATVPPEVQRGLDERDRRLRELVEAGDGLVDRLEWAGANLKDDDAAFARWRAAVIAMRGDG